ncbi:MAG: shikimate dehydrogenase [Bacteroidia bacterium]|nr:shikimate dehydrogenase [Bacteroidia bacterium]
MHQLDESAAKIGAVNCIKINRTPNHIELIGYNTDAFGFKVSLQKFIPPNFHSSALILGNGGASKAVQFVCNELQIGFTLVTSKLVSSHINLINYHELNKDVLANNLLVINTTPLGMFPHVHLFPLIDYEGIKGNHFCFDLIYLPEETAFLKKAKQQGAKIKNGLEMLNEQANRAFDIFVANQLV